LAGARLVTRSLVWLVCDLVTGAEVVAAWDAVGRACDALIPHATAAAPQILNADRFGVGALGRVERASGIRRVGEASCARARVDATLCRAADRVLTLEDGRIRPQNPSKETRRSPYAMAT
jgi:hypothetical protein